MSSQNLPTIQAEYESVVKPGKCQVPRQGADQIKEGLIFLPQLIFNYCNILSNIPFFSVFSLDRHCIQERSHNLHDPVGDLDISRAMAPRNKARFPSCQLFYDDEINPIFL